VAQIFEMTENSALDMRRTCGDVEYFESLKRAAFRLTGSFETLFVPLFEISPASSSFF
jgi:hypothetical protein